MMDLKFLFNSNFCSIQIFVQFKFLFKQSIFVQFKFLFNSNCNIPAILVPKRGVDVVKSRSIVGVDQLSVDQLSVDQLSVDE
jgi:hypothetical protein